MDLQFEGSALRLARLYNELTLEDVAAKLGKTRQYIYKLETSPSDPGFDLVRDLASALRVRPDFFYFASAGVPEEAIHFRKLFTTRAAVKHHAMAKAEVFRRLVAYLDSELQLPAVRLPSVQARSTSDVETAADECRRQWGLGLGPIDHVIRLAENVGCVVTTFTSISGEVDALSIGGPRPIIVRNDAKQNACRERFDVAHEMAHAVLHEGLQTGDRLTEGEAHRFAGALLVPRSMMMKWFPRQRRTNLDWASLAEFKTTWGISKAAALYRARELDLISDEQYRRGVVHLKTRGEAITEKGDELRKVEQPELVATAVEFLRNRRGITMANIANVMHVSLEWIQELVGTISPDSELPSNVVHMRGPRA
jgi:Zn-dependent peptidase ImmA (M78 family)/transcriptional regulator with XRE-family HTH domain